jgi:hypothetical protein
LAEVKPTTKVQECLDTIAAYEREFKSWEQRVEKIQKRYRDEKRASGEKNTKFNCLWANIQTLVPACYSRLPQPDVSRRFRDNDPTGRVAALILERALEYEIQHYKDFRRAMKMAVRARFLGGRGVAWARYEPHISADQVQVTEDVDESEINEQLDYECSPTDYVNWKDFGHSVARTWEEVTVVWRKVYMGRAAVAKRFGKDIAKKIPYDASPNDDKRTNKDQAKKQALIYEVWDKDEGKAYWLSKSHPEFLDERDDPLQLEDFFPCPEPLYATLTEDSLIPVPDFTIYQDQANSLDILADRIHGLCEMLQVKGCYDAAAGSELARLLTEGQNGDLLPVKNWAAFAEKKGLMGQVDILDIKPIAEALKIAVEAFAQKKAEMDELSGVIDVIRGDVNPEEKLGQTELKGQYASLRLRDKQQDVAEFATGLLQLKAQIICTKFNPKTIAAMAAVDQLAPADQKVVPQAMALLIGEERLQDPDAEAPNPMRSFRIGVVADTLVEIDENAEKQSAVELLTGVGGFLEKAAMVAQGAPQLVPLLLELLKWGVTRFKVGKTVEGTIDEAIDQLKQQIQMMQGQPPPPDPKVEAEKAKLEVVKEKGQMDIQVAREKAGIEMQKMQGQQQMQQQQMALDQQEHQQHMQMQQQDMALDQQGQQMKQQHMQAQHQQRMAMVRSPSARRQ